MVERTGYWCRYAYARSTDSRATNDVGQDRLVLRIDDQQISLVLCDGVSQSFVGDLAARMLADALLDWLSTTVESSSATVIESLTDRLTVLVAEAQSAIDGFMLPDDIPPMLRDVLEQKRALGSESTFIAVLIDVTMGRMVLAWMGDSRLRLWGIDAERTREFGESFHTAERWSSRRGAVGSPHVAVLTLADVTRLLIYSDGLSQLDHQGDNVLSNEELNVLIEDVGNAPTSDDVSLVEIWLQQAEPQPDAEVVLQQAEPQPDAEVVPQQSELLPDAEVVPQQSESQSDAEGVPQQSEPQPDAEVLPQQSEPQPDAEVLPPATPHQTDTDDSYGQVPGDLRIVPVAPSIPVTEIRASEQTDPPGTQNALMKRWPLLLILAGLMIVGILLFRR
ncbi:MAG: protein phosphatase 2C domain-containing protein [Chloroflexales bacterium]